MNRYALVALLALAALPARADTTIALSGPVDWDMVRALERATNRAEPGPITIEIDSRGGRVDAGFEIATKIKMLRLTGHAVITRVTRNCMSMCVVIYAEGDRRVAAPDSKWMLHAAENPTDEADAERATAKTVSILIQRGVNPDWLTGLVARGVFTTPKTEARFSGADLYATHSNLVTEIEP